MVCPLTPCPVHVAEVAQTLLDRGDLPARIVLRLPFGRARPGDVYVWRARTRGYVDAQGRDRVISAGVVRHGWGVLFAPAPQQELSLDA